MPNCIETERAAFQAMQALARAEDLHILPPDAPFVTNDEKRILGILAMLQRQVPGYTFTCSREMRSALTECVRILNRLDLWLPWTNLVRTHEATPTHRALETWPAWRERQRRRARIPFYPPELTSLQARVLRFVNDQQLPWHALRDYGVTQQFLLLMIHRNLLLRDRSGNYRASPDATGWLSSLGSPQE